MSVNPPYGWGGGCAALCASQAPPVQGGLYRPSGSSLSGHLEGGVIKIKKNSVSVCVSVCLWEGLKTMH